MKKVLSAIAFALSAAWLPGQIMLTDAYFPTVGDTLKTNTDFTPEGIAITPPGGPFTWDFGGLGANLQQATVYRNATEGNAAASFPNAELFADFGAGAETYFSVSPNAFEVLGFNGPDPVGLGLQTLFKFTSPIPERRAPLSFPASHSSASDVLVPFPIDALPASFLDSLGVPAIIDSIRVRVTAERSDFVDAYGTLTIPGGTYEVLREKRTELRETRVDGYFPIFGWQDLTDIIIAAANFPGLGKDTIITYNFFSNDAKEAIAVVRMDNAGEVVTQVQYKDNGVASSSQDLASQSESVSVFPNPVDGEARFDLKNFSPGNYAVQLFDATGSLVLVKNFDLSGSSHPESLDLTMLQAGPYFYRILNKKNETLGVGKLLKIEP